VTVSRASACTFLLLSSLLPGCDREGRTRAEARTFLALYEATDHRAPVPERERKVAQLEQLTLTDESVRQARDECVAAHKALISAEHSNERAAGQLDRAIAGQPDGEPLAEGATAAIRTGIEQAERSLKDARTRFEKCESKARDLSVHYGER
jgi:hypothetical protein